MQNRRWVTEHALTFSGYWLLTNLDDNVSPRLKSLNAPTGTNSMTIFEHDSRLFLVATHGTGIVVYSLNLVRRGN